MASAMADGGIPRDELFVTTKLWPDHADSPADALRASLEQLQLDFVDCYLVHWPGLNACTTSAAAARQRVWRQMELLQEAGLARCIGVSNFLERHLDDLVDGAGETSGVPISINQIELGQSAGAC